jgi:hypothetical protein
MRISVPFGRHGSTTAKFVFAAVTAVLLSGCSDSIDRFAANYSNPSDADPVYTASVPKYRKVATQKYVRPRAIANYDEEIVEAPIKAPKYKAVAPKYDYTDAYKKPFKAAEVAYDAPKAPVYKKPTYAAPVIQDEQVAEDVLAAPVIKKAKYKSLAYKAPVFEEEVVTPVASTLTTKKPVVKKQVAGASVIQLHALTAFQCKNLLRPIISQNLIQFRWDVFCKFPAQKQPKCRLANSFLWCKRKSKQPLTLLRR